MRSLIILEVEHGEDTDALDLIVDHNFVGQPMQFGDVEYRITNYTVRVDLPECFRLES